MIDQGLKIKSTVSGFLAVTSSPCSVSTVRSSYGAFVITHLVKISFAFSECPLLCSQTPVTGQYLSPSAAKPTLYKLFL